MKSWVQKGYAVVCDSHGYPLLHDFVTTKWEAESKLKEAMEYPEHLRVNIQIVPAEIAFSFPTKEQDSDEG